MKDGEERQVNEWERMKERKPEGEFLSSVTLLSGSLGLTFKKMNSQPCVPLSLCALRYSYCIMKAFFSPNRDNLELSIIKNSTSSCRS